MLKREAIAYYLTETDGWDLAKSLAKERSEQLVEQICSCASWEEYLALKGEMSGLMFVINMIEDIAEQWNPIEE